MTVQETLQEDFDMANIEELQKFAEEHNFGLTAPLTHNQVERLAQQWSPQIFFFEAEKFHPIALEQMNNMIKAVFDNPELPETAKDAWRINLLVRTGENIGDNRAFDPPVVRVPDGIITRQPTNPNLPPLVLKVFSVLNDGIPFEEALAHPLANEYAVITHGASFQRSDHFFGARVTLSGGNVPAKGDPFKPRAEKDEKPLMTVYASYKNLLDTLEYELAVEEEEKYPPDALRRGFNIADLLFHQIPFHPDPAPFTPTERRNILKELIATEKANGPIEEILKNLPLGWELNLGIWRALTRYAFLEYEFFYAYNDFERVQTSFFDNEHEGDNEGCCLVFDRRLINLAAMGDDPNNPKLLLQVVPDAIITSVHEEWQEADIFQLIPQPISPPDDPEELKKLVNLAVYAAWGSHATYLMPGNHPLVDFQDMTSFIGENILLLLILADPNLALTVLILALIIEHFDDPQDVTSETGIRSVPEETLEEGPHDPHEIPTRLNVLPMTFGDHIYTRNRYENLLRLRSFAGKWGAHDNTIDHSPKFETKTARYFRKLLRNL
jgi:hypothetical protein